MSAVKTKDITYTRVSRCLLHLLLEIKKEDMEYYKLRDYCPYTRLLGFRKSSTDLLHAIKKNSSLPIITKMPRQLPFYPQKISPYLKKKSLPIIFMKQYGHKNMETIFITNITKVCNTSFVTT